MGVDSYKSIKYISYWCTRCGAENCYPYCAAMEVYIRCPNCSEHRPIQCVKSKLIAIKIINDRRLYNTRRLCKLTGMKFEDVFDKPNIGSIFNKWIDKEEKKRQR